MTEVLNTLLELQVALVQNGGNQLNIEIDTNMFQQIEKMLFDLGQGQSSALKGDYIILNGPMCATKITKVKND